MENTYGIFLVNDQGLILIGHPTKSGISGWTIPKGRPEEGEDPLTTALREFKEESGIDLTLQRNELVFLGTEVYKSKKKQIHAYLLKTNKEFAEPVCMSLVVDKGEPFYPELDQFKWATFDEAYNLLYVSQKQLLLNNKEKFV
jgi:predicted NUDIX family NTP pyrophosphohydrolase